MFNFFARSVLQEIELRLIVELYVNQNSTATAATLTSSSLVATPTEGKNMNNSSWDNDSIADAEALEMPRAILLSFTLGLISLLTVVGNLFVILAILTDRELKRPQNFLILSLACADCTVGLLVLPLSTFNEVNMGRWTLGPQLCELWIFLDMMACTASILHLVAIAVDRYRSVTDVQYGHKRTFRTVGIMLLSVWVTSLLISVLPIAGWKDVEFYTRVDNFVCLVSQELGYQIFSTSVAFYLPLLVIISLYVAIYRAAKRRIRKRSSVPAVSQPLLVTPTANGTATTTVTNSPMPSGRHLGIPVTNEPDSTASVTPQKDPPSNGEDSGDATIPLGRTKSNLVSVNKRIRKKNSMEVKRERKVFKTLAIITGTFFLCWGSFFIIALFRPLCKCDFDPTMVSVFNWLGWLNSMLNPMIYTAFAPDFRNAFKKILMNICGQQRVR